MKRPFFCLVPSCYLNQFGPITHQTKKKHNGFVYALQNNIFAYQGIIWKCFRKNMFYFYRTKNVKVAIIPTENRWILHGAKRQRREFLYYESTFQSPLAVRGQREINEQMNLVDECYIWITNCIFVTECNTVISVSALAVDILYSCTLRHW